MRSMILATLLVASTASAETFDAQSDRHVMNVTRTGSQYTVVISDRDTRKPLATFNLDSSQGGKRVATTDVGNAHVIARLTLLKDEDAVHANVVENGYRDLLTVVAPLPDGQERGQISGPPYRVGGEVRAPKVIQRIEPAYTDDLRARRISGLVILETEISETGDIEDVLVLKGPPELAQAAVDAVSQWKFEPATLDGKPVRAIFNLTVNFKIN